jgi:exopolysaccharide biosynthesis WecB/TagA/CpsF family protein
MRAARPPLRDLYMQRISLMSIPIDLITEWEVVARILAELRHGRGGWVVTPNLDHLRVLSRQPSLLRIASEANLLIADGMPLVWASRLQGTPLPARVPGSDLILSLTAAAAQAGLSVFLLGGSTGTAEAAVPILKRRFPGLRIAGVLCPPMGFDDDPAQMIQIFSTVVSARPDIVYSCFGFPKQEWVIQQLRQGLPATWFLGLGGSLSMITGELPRAPIWMRKTGLEWMHRMALEPRRLFKRYIVNDLPFAARLFSNSLKYRLSARTKAVPLAYDSANAHPGVISSSTEQFWSESESDHDGASILSHVARRRLLRQYRFIDSRISRQRRHWRFHSRRFAWITLIVGATAMKRLIDIVGSFFLLFVLAPFLAAISALIKIDSPGPALFTQVRVGKWGRTFKMYKFRSMHQDAEHKKKDLLLKNEMAGGVIFKMKDDPRISRVGKILRRYSIDEIPQLLNVLKGDMSLVGPRPPLPSEVELYTLAERRRLDVEPGITCIWQVSGRSEIPFDKQVELDIAYIDSQSVWGDVKLLLKTLPTVLKGRGAY